jgi:hypothetical protein
MLLYDSKIIYKLASIDEHLRQLYADCEVAKVRSGKSAKTIRVGQLVHLK